MMKPVNWLSFSVLTVRRSSSHRALVVDADKWLLASYCQGSLFPSLLRKLKIKNHVWSVLFYC